jgi:polyisoprenoid-binding protein YceI
MKRALLMAGFVCAALPFAISPAAAAPEQLTLTPADMLSQTHSHAVIMSITGTFKELSGKLTFDPDTKACTVDVIFQVKTMALPLLAKPQVMSKGFLDPDDYPTMHYVGTCQNQGQGPQLVGTLTMHGQTHPFTMAVTYINDSSGKLIGFDSEGTLDRTQWGVDGLQMLVGQNIRVTNDISLNGQPPQAPQS